MNAVEMIFAVEMRWLPFIVELNSRLFLIRMSITVVCHISRPVGPSAHQHVPNTRAHTYSQCTSVPQPNSVFRFSIPFPFTFNFIQSFRFGKSFTLFEFRLCASSLDCISIWFDSFLSQQQADTRHLCFYFLCVCSFSLSFSVSHCCRCSGRCHHHHLLLESSFSLVFFYFVSFILIALFWLILIIELNS